MEIWRDIPGFENFYQVSDCGQVKSVERFRKNGKNGYVQKERILKPSLHTGGYYKVKLCKDGKLKDFFIHRLVALVFIDGDNSLTVNHKDECKTNNHISNLEYLSNGDNTRAWNKNNLERKAELNGKKVLDTQTGKLFPSITAVGRYMYEKENAKNPRIWDNRIRIGKQDRFQILNNND